MIPERFQRSAYPGDAGGAPRVGHETTRFEMPKDNSESVKGIMTEVLRALKEKGYNPVNQLVGYFLSGDPTYITNHLGARGVIRRMERDELLEVIIQEYIRSL
ncbi:MAG: IreB family regulatory phosphoprotein [Clostridia bacterium]|nr:IreB family regulatory phosphoprotein [Clostridia bacterium]